MKTKLLFLFSVILVCVSISFSSCSKDNEDNSLKGYWISKSVCEKSAKEAIDEGWIYQDGTGGGTKAYHFINENTVEVLDAWGFCQKRMILFIK